MTQITLWIPIDDSIPLDYFLVPPRPDNRRRYTDTHRHHSNYYLIVPLRQIDSSLMFESLLQRFRRFLIVPKVRKGF